MNGSMYFLFIVSFFPGLCLLHPRRDRFQSPPSRSSTSPITPTSPTRPLSVATITAVANSGLDINMSAAQLRARLASRKKFDPKRDTIDLRRKHEIIQTMWENELLEIKHICNTPKNGEELK